MILKYFSQNYILLATLLVSYAHQSCIYLFKNTVKTEILQNKCFHVNVIYSCDDKAEFSVSHDESLY